METIKTISIWIGVTAAVILVFCNISYYYFLSNLPSETKTKFESNVLEDRFLDVWWKDYGSSERKEKASFGVSEYLVRAAIAMHDKNPAPELNLYSIVARKKIHSSTARMSNLRWHFSTLVLATWLSKHWNVDEAISYVLEESYYGSGVFGIENASKQYFCKAYQELTVQEIAVLIGLLKGPNYFTPYRHPDRCLKRANLILSNISPKLVMEKLPNSLCNGDTTTVE